METEDIRDHGGSLTLRRSRSPAVADGGVGPTASGDLPPPSSSEPYSSQVYDPNAGSSQYHGANGGGAPGTGYESAGVPGVSYNMGYGEGFLGSGAPGGPGGGVQCPMK